MRLTIKAKQVLGVVSIVGLATSVLTYFYVSSLVDISLSETKARGDLLANAIYQRAQALVAIPDLSAALRQDEGLRSALESSAYSDNVMYAAIVDVNGAVIAHNDTERIGQVLPNNSELDELLGRSTIGQLGVIYSGSAKTLEVRKPLLLGSNAFGFIRIGVSTLLIRNELNKALRGSVLTLVATLVASTIVATLLAQLLLRPIHVLRHRLARLGENDFGVADDLPRDEFGELGDSLAAVSARLLADKAGQSVPQVSLETPGWLEDAVAVFNDNGEVLLANARMRTLLPPDPVGRTVAQLLTPGHPYRRLVEESLADRRSHGPLVLRAAEHAQLPSGEGGVAVITGEQLVRADVMGDTGAGPFSIMVVARDLEHLRHVQSRLNYARRVATLGRLSAGLAHEIKNPLHATMIRLELLTQLLAEEEPNDTPSLLEHVAVIRNQMRRLDEVVQGFLKFIRPEELRLQPVQLSVILEGIMPVVEAEARSHRIQVTTEWSRDLPDLNADSAVLKQAFLNLALNACQATPPGGSLRISAAPARNRHIEVIFEDTGTGIPPEDIEKIFDLYFTTKESGSGIGLSMVFRAVHLHNGEIEVQSTPGRGTTFRLLLPQA